MAAERVPTQQKHVAPQHEAANAQPKLRLAIRQCLTRRVRAELHTQDGVITKNKNKRRRHIKKVTVDVLEDERELVFTPIAVPGLTDRAVYGVCPERLVVGTPVVITGETESRWCPKYKKRRRHPMGHPTRHDSQPSMSCQSAFQFGRKRRQIMEVYDRRKKWREIVGSALHRQKMLAVKRPPSGIDNERRQAKKSEQWLQPPHITSHGFSKPSFCKGSLSVGHKMNRAPERATRLYQRLLSESRTDSIALHLAKRWAI